jgi:hypothetical protein
MIKFKNTLKIFLPLVLFLFFGCSLKNDTRKDSYSYQSDKAAKYTVPHNLNDLEEVYDNMDYKKVIDKYSHYIPSSATVTRFRYYVIFSMLDENTTYELIDKNIRQTIDAMTDNYLSDFPDSVIPVFLFSDFDEYKEFSTSTFGIEEDDLSPFGFYKITKNAIVIKFYKWKGSVSHEITHSLIQFDFPDMPSWFNEGLASLHEKYIYKDGQMLGDFSWRIIALRHSLEHNTYTGLRKLMETDDEELYDSGRTSYYYAQARYLLMMLQQQGLLKKYYKLFKDTYDEDNTGISQLEKVTGKPLNKIDKELVEYVNGFDMEW